MELERVGDIAGDAVVEVVAGVVAVVEDTTEVVCG